MFTKNTLDIFCFVLSNPRPLLSYPKWNVLLLLGVCERTPLSLKQAQKQLHDFKIEFNDKARHHFSQMSYFITELTHVNNGRLHLVPKFVQ